MVIKIKTLLSISLCCLVINGCTSTNNTDAYYVGFEFNQPVAGFCNIVTDFSNNTDKNIKPVLQLIVFDNDLNTLTEQNLYFDTILGSKKQSKPTIVAFNCSKIKRITLVRVADLFTGKSKVYNKNYDWR